MTGHTLIVDREKRWSVLGRTVVDWRAEDAYPCKTTCKESHTHSGEATCVYATCSCGWRHYIGNINVSDADVTMVFLQHQIDELYLYGDQLRHRH